MFTKLLLGVVIIELWCYLHEAHDVIALWIGGLIVCVILDSIVDGVRHAK